MKKRSTRPLVVALLAVVGALAVSVSVAMAFDSGATRAS